MNYRSMPKKDYERAVKKSVSMPGMLFDQGDAQRRRNQISTFSDYVQELIRKDLAANSGKRVA